MLASFYRHVNLLKPHNKVFSLCVRCLHVGVRNYKDIKQETASSSSSGGDLFKRPVRGLQGKVKHGFIPVEWFNYFTPKTGVTGFYTFLFTTSTYLFSKEIMVMEHNFYNGLSMLAICVALTKKFGKSAAEQIDKHLDEYEKDLSQNRNDQKKTLEDAIEQEKKLQWSCEGQQQLVDAKRENVHLQREAEFRKRLIHVYEEVKKRLDCQIKLTEVEGRFVHKNIVSYVVHEVTKSLTPDFLNKYMEKCIDDFAAIAKKIK